MTRTPTPWNYKYIRQLSDEAGVRAAVQGLRPSLVTEVVKNYAHSRRFNIPFLGDCVPYGWERVDWLIEPVFVDTTGKGKPGDPAIPAFEFLRRAEQHLKTESSIVLGYGVIEWGQTQALVAVYRRL